MKYRGKADYIYVAVSKDLPNGPVKVGWTTDPSRRPMSAVCGRRQELDYAYIHPVKEGYGRAYEQRVHGYLENYRNPPGEWFACTPEIAIQQFPAVDWYFKEIEKKNIEIDKKYYLMLFEQNKLKIV